MSEKNEANPNELLQIMLHAEDVARRIREALTAWKQTDEFKAIPFEQQVTAINKKLAELRQTIK